jgi:diacylglycerol kinase
MTKFKSSGVKESISNAVHGLMLAVFSQRNFVIELIISAVVIIMGLIFRFTATDMCILIIMIALVLICELLNSVIEFTLDAVYKNNYSRLVEMAKDMSAGMVLLIACISVLVGAILFGSYSVKYYKDYVLHQNMQNANIINQEIII